MTANPLLGGAGGGGAGAGGLPDPALMQNIMRSFSQGAAGGGAAGSAGSRSANVERILSNPAAMQVSCSALISSHLINILKY